MWISEARAGRLPCPAGGSSAALPCQPLTKPFASRTIPHAGALLLPSGWEQRGGSFVPAASAAGWDPGPRVPALRSIALSAQQLLSTDPAACLEVPEQRQPGAQCQWLGGPLRVLTI